MNKDSFASVWDAIEDDHAEAQNMRLRSALMIALKNHIARDGLSQKAAAQLLGHPVRADHLTGVDDCRGPRPYHRVG